MELRPDSERQQVQAGGAEPRTLALVERRGEVQRGEEVQEVRVPQKGRRLETPGVEPVDHRESGAFPRREDRAQAAVEERPGDEVQQPGEDHRRAVIAPDRERPGHQQGGRDPRAVAPRGERIAVRDQLAAFDEQPAAREQVELVAAGLGANDHQGREHQAERYREPAQRLRREDLPGWHGALSQSGAVGRGRWRWRPRLSPDRAWRSRRR